jgi:carbonic anhydrase
VKRLPAEDGHEAAKLHAHIHWDYEGEGRPDNWGRLKPEFATCASGKRQSPIDIRDGIRVDQPAIGFDWRPSQFRIVDNGHTVQVHVGGSSIVLLGKRYELIQFHFHRPAEERVNGRGFEMVTHFVHKAEDGKLAVVAVLMEGGAENPFIQTLWNHMPLEKNQDVAPPSATVDPSAFLPADRGYYSYMGSLTTPPCTEDVLWLVMKQPVQVSAEQISIFSRLYRHNARPVQPSFGRLIKESR